MWTEFETEQRAAPTRIKGAESTESTESAERSKSTESAKSAEGQLKKKKKLRIGSTTCSGSVKNKAQDRFNKQDWLKKRLGSVKLKLRIDSTKSFGSAEQSA